jgi:hypothetical protein
MSGMAMDRRGEGGAAESRGAAVTAIFLWLVVIAGLAYGLVNTLLTVADLFSG